MEILFRLPIATLSSDCTDSEAGVNGVLTYDISQVNGVPGDGPFEVTSTGGLIYESILDTTYILIKNQIIRLL